MLKVLLIGDPIRKGYEFHVWELLKGMAGAYGVEISCGPMTRELRHIAEWLDGVTWGSSALLELHSHDGSSKLMKEVGHDVKAMGVHAGVQGPGGA